jgi:hypothetical protein
LKSVIIITESYNKEIVIYLDPSPVMLNAIQISITKNNMPGFYQPASISRLSRKEILLYSSE